MFQKGFAAYHKKIAPNPFPGVAKVAQKSMAKGRAGKDFEVLRQLVDQALGEDAEAFDLVTSEDFQHQ